MTPPRDRWLPGRVADGRQDYGMKLPDEPREHTAVGGGDPEGNDNASLTPEERAEAHAAASRKAVAAVEAEPSISNDVRSIVDANGGRLERFDTRLKTFESLYRKIQGIMVEDETEAEDAAAEIRDAIRYTVVLDEQGYWANGSRIRAALQRAGYTPVKTPSGWKRFGYKGRNDTFVTANGREFEVQMHTRASLDAAENCHVLYEEWRLASTAPTRKAQLIELMNEIFAAVPVPDDVELVN